MAESKKQTKKEETKETTKKKVTKTDYSKLSVKDLKTELQKVYLNVKIGKEKNTSLIKKIKKEIARKHTSKK